MLNLDPAKLLIIAVVAVILLGPDKLPQVARQAGAAWRSFNDFRQRMEDEVRSSIPDLPSTNDIARLARSPTALLDHLSSLDGTSSADPPADESGEPPLSGDRGTGRPQLELTVAHRDLPLHRRAQGEALARQHDPQRSIWGSCAVA